MDNFVEKLIISGNLNQKNIDFIINQYGQSSSNNYNINNMRNFHNLIKKNLICHYTSKINAISLLDIACGKGGDLQKWLLTKLSYVFGFDNCEESIIATNQNNGYDGAITRWKNLQRYNQSKKKYIRFEHLNVLQSDITKKLSELDGNKEYDIISCQFALHYFSKNVEMLKHVFKLISNKLKKGGYFIGTASNGDYIKNILKTKGNFNLQMLTLVRSVSDDEVYLYYINESNINQERKNYFQLNGVSKEYFLTIDKINKVLKDPEINLEIVEFKSFYEWYNDIELVKNLKEINSYPLNINEMIISFLNFSFVFIKK